MTLKVNFSVIAFHIRNKYNLYDILISSLNKIFSVVM
jgi:hypothetical protein